MRGSKRQPRPHSCAAGVWGMYRRACFACLHLILCLFCGTSCAAGCLRCSLIHHMMRVLEFVRQVGGRMCVPQLTSHHAAHGPYGLPLQLVVARAAPSAEWAHAPRVRELAVALMLLCDAIVSYVRLCPNVGRDVAAAAALQQQQQQLPHALCTCCTTCAQWQGRRHGCMGCASACCFLYQHPLVHMLLLVPQSP